MTKREKKDLALKLKAEIEAKKPVKEGPVITPEQKKKNNRVRYAVKRAKNYKKNTLGEKNFKYFDFDKW